MKKNKIVIIVLILGILFLTSYLYNSYATSTGVSLGNDENTYDILLNDSTDTVSVPAKSSKTVYYQFSNTNKGTVKYHIGYTSDNVIAKVWWDSEDKISGTIEQGEYKFIKLKLINDTTSDDTITIKPVLGYVNGGDVIPDSNTTLVTGTINETNVYNRNIPVSKTNIEKLYFVNDNIVPFDALGSTSASTDGSIMTWYTDEDENGIYEVYVGSDNGISTFTGTCKSAYNGWSNLTYADFTYVDTSNVTDMQSMFYNDQKLITLKISNFDTSMVSNMLQMFSRCSSLSELDVSNFNTSRVQNMSSMFNNCSSLVNLELSNFNTSNVKNMSNMFDGCSSLEKLDVSNFDTSIVESMASMFVNCSSLVNLELSNFNTSNVRNMSSMFNTCSSLVNLELSNFNTSNVRNMSSMFNTCSSLKNLDLSNFDTSSVTNMEFMFNNCSNLSSINLSGWDTKKVSTMRRMFYGCSKLMIIDLSSFETPLLTDARHMFYNGGKKTVIDMRNATLDGITAGNGYVMWGSGATTIYLKDTQGNRDFMSNNFPSVTGVQYIPSS